MTTPALDGACCACIKVTYDPERHADGSFSERWCCSSCGAIFIKRARVAELERERDKVRAEVERLREESNKRGLAERTWRGRAEKHAAEVERLRALHDLAHAAKAEAEHAAHVAREEVERLRRECDVRAVIERCPKHDAPTLVDGYQKQRRRITCAECCDEDRERLREALEKARNAIHFRRHGYSMVANTSPGHPVFCDALCRELSAALAGSPVEREGSPQTQRKLDASVEYVPSLQRLTDDVRRRALAERVRLHVAEQFFLVMERGDVSLGDAFDKMRALDLDALMEEP